MGYFGVVGRGWGAPGEFAQAYVIAHEVGHHVQHVLGIAPRVREAQERDPSARNTLSVRMELQADCLAGAWARSVGERGQLDPGDVEAGLRAAAAGGGDPIHRKNAGSVKTQSFTHGTAEQRARWFRRGYDSARLDACDTFGDGAVARDGEGER